MIDMFFSPAIPMPTPDPLGYPLPLWILQWLSYATLTLHLTAVQFTFGLALLFVWLHLATQASQREGVCHYIKNALPLGVSYLITLGIPPLLFVQVIYGQQFYSASILIGAFWMLIIPLLILAYLGFYYLKLASPARSWVAPLVAAVCAALMLHIGFTYVNNFTLTLTPDKWLSLYQASPAGFNLNQGEAMRWPRLALFLSPSLCIAGLSLLFLAKHRSRWPDCELIARFGRRSYIAGAYLTVLAGYFCVHRLPASVLTRLSTDPSALGFLLIAVTTLALGLLFALFSNFKRGLWAPIGATVCTILCLASVYVIRDLVRIEYLRPYFSPATIAVNPQWGMFSFFLLMISLGVLCLLWLTAKILRERSSISLGS